MSALSVRLLDSLHEKLKEVVQKEGVSMNWIVNLSIV
jgi:predicted HicB family RNase H-like nuclease